jgi:hypothetical protein
MSAWILILWLRGGDGIVMQSIIMQNRESCIGAIANFKIKADKPGVFYPDAVCLNNATGIIYDH